jgi:hypothetical protein
VVDQFALGEGEQHEGEQQDLVGHKIF